MDKNKIIQIAIDHLEAEMNAQTQAAQSSFQDATDEESKAESKYDTRGLETSYLAGGQAKIAAEAQVAFSRFKNMEIRDFGPDDCVALTALITVRNGRYTDYYLLGASGGGVEIEAEGKQVMLITGQSPVGQALLGKRVGESVELQLGRNKQTLEITAIS